jgi:hypothetical protein
MTRFSSIRLVFAIALVLALVAVSMAGALPVEKPEAVYPTASGWFGFALQWLEDVTGFRPQVPGHPRDGSNPQSLQKGGNVTPTGGSCIDPEGNPRCG